MITLSLYETKAYQDEIKRQVKKGQARRSNKRKRIQK